MRVLMSKELKNTLKYKFIESLTKKVNNDDFLSKALMKGMISLHDNFGDKKLENASNELKSKFEIEEKNRDNVKRIIKKQINQYNEQCSSSLTSEDQIEMIVVLLDYILRKTEGQSNADLEDSLKYINKITDLACDITSRDHKNLILEYTKYIIQNKANERTNFLFELFNKYKS